MEKVEQDAILAAEMVGGLGVLAITAPMLAAPSGFSQTIGVAGLAGALFLGYDGYQRWEDREHSVTDSFVTLRGPLEMLGGSYLVYKGVNFFFDSQGLSSNSLKTFDLALGAVFVSAGGYVMWDGWKHWGDKPGDKRQPIGATPFETTLSQLYDQMIVDVDDCSQAQIAASEQLFREGYKYGQTSEEQDQWNQMVKQRIPVKCRNPVYDGDGVLTGYRQDDGSFYTVKDEDKFQRAKIVQKAADCASNIRFANKFNNSGKTDQDYSTQIQQRQIDKCLSKELTSTIGSEYKSYIEKQLGIKVA